MIVGAFKNSNLHHSIEALLVAERAIVFVRGGGVVSLRLHVNQITRASVVTLEMCIYYLRC